MKLRVVYLKLTVEERGRYKFTRPVELRVFFHVSFNHYIVSLKRSKYDFLSERSKVTPEFYNDISMKSRVWIRIKYSFKRDEKELRISVSQERKVSPRGVESVKYNGIHKTLDVEGLKRKESLRKEGLLR